MVVSYCLCETVGVDRENVRILKSIRGSSVTEEEHQEVNSFGIVVEVTMNIVSEYTRAVWSRARYILPEHRVIR